MKKSLLFLFSLVSIQIATSQQTKLPYPIIFVHGLHGSSDNWINMANQLNQQYGLVPGDRLDFCLNQDGDRSTASLIFYPDNNADIRDFVDTTQLSVADFYFVNFDVGPNGIFHPFLISYVQSNQQAITKQGLALSRAIKYVLQKTHKDKVILIGHSMGGLAIREYLQNSSDWQLDGNHHVAKVVTVGTPHGGSNAYFPSLLSDIYYLPNAEPGIDIHSEAVRDLRGNYQYSHAPGVFLFGGDENNSVMDDISFSSFDNVDVNCSGVLNETITGLNNRPISDTVEYSCIIGECASCNPIGQELPGDGVVNDTSANLAFCIPNTTVNEFHFYGTAAAQIHSDLVDQIPMNIRGLDEPGTMNLAYEIKFNSTYLGFSTKPSDFFCTNKISAFNNHNSEDIDIYRFNVPAFSTITAHINNFPIGLLACFIDPIGQTVSNIVSCDIDSIISQDLAPGTYGLKFIKIVNNETDISSYSFRLTQCFAINVVLDYSDNSQFSVSANGGHQPYQYSLDSIHWQSSGTFDSLTAGRYWVYVKDSFGCPGQTTVDITVPCNQITSSGGQETITIPQQLGSVAGIVKVAYQMYTIPDEMTIEYNGIQVASTGGLVSGADTLSFVYDPPAGGPFVCYITMFAPTSGTAWDFTAHCPTGQITTLPITERLCQGSSFIVGFTTDFVTLNPGNVYTVQLSNATGSFSNPTVIGSYASTGVSGGITVTIPTSTPYGTGYRIRVVSSNEPAIGYDNGSPLTIRTLSMASVSITQTGGANPGCAGSTITFTATPSNGGTPQYQWQVNGVNAVGATSSTYSSSTLSTNDVVRCLIKSTATCDTNYVASNSIQLSFITPNLSISIAASANNICAGTNVTFTATVPVGTQGPYQWLKNGANLSLTSGPTYSTSSLANNDIISCVLTNTSYGCISLANRTSNSITMAVIPKVTPAITITSTSNSICAGQSITFTAAITNGGSTPSYQWRNNGVNIPGATSSTYSSSTLANGNVISCRLTSSITCVTSTSATSNNITVAVYQNVAPTITIASSYTTFCPGTLISLTSTQTNGGNPTYQWRKNGLDIAGATSSIYSSNAFINGDVLTCVMTSSIGCLPTTVVTSNSISMNVSTSVAPAISIAASANNVCQGTSITFTATVSNGVLGPYQWKKNGTNLSTTSSPTFSTSSLANNDLVTCVINDPAYSCIQEANRTSNAITMVIIPKVTPTISIASSGNSICASQNVTFVASITNGGTTPIYQWRVNGANMTGANSSIFTSNTLVDGDAVSCRLTSSVPCVTSSTATSSSITMAVYQNVAPTIVITSNYTTFCPGTQITFTSAQTNGGSPTYQWKKNGLNISGATSATYIDTSFTNGDVVTCVMTSSANCLPVTVVTSNAITLSVTTAIAPTISITASTNNVCQGTSITFTATTSSGAVGPYQWKKNGTNLSSTTSPTYATTTLANNDVITCVLTNTSYNCVPVANRTSNSITMAITPKVTPTITITSTGNSICVGQTATFTSTITNGGNTPTYQWRVNGINITGATSSSYVTDSLVNGDIVSCRLTSSLPCVTSSTVTSSSITMAVYQNVTPTITISTTTPMICPAKLVTLTSSQVSGGSPTYQWQKNGSNIPNANSSSYSDSTFNNGDIVTCVMTSSISCLSVTQVTSNAVTMIVSSSFTPTFNISASSNSICQGSIVTFTAVPGNGTVGPYQWKKNGTNVGTGTTYSSSAIANNDVITCVLTYAGYSCLPISNKTSNAITMSVITKVTPSANISSNYSSICAGDSVTFVATPTNGGATPSYQWRKNGSITGGNNNIFITTSLNPNDSVWVVMTTSETCITASTATSNKVKVTVTPSPIPSITISPASSVVCPGSGLTFTAQTTAAGSTPSFQWLLNGANSGGGNTYTLSNINSDDTVYCLLTSSAACAFPLQVPSNKSYILSFAPAISNIYQTICTGQIYQGHTSSGIFPDTLPGASMHGCDSIVILNLTVLQNAVANIIRSICQGQNYLGHSLSGSYIDTLHNGASNGCDSIVHLNLSVLPLGISFISRTICSGQVYLGHATSGIYIDTLQASNGCDSIRHLNLTVIPLVSSIINQAICAGQNYIGYSVSGTYIDTLHGASVNGCDSVRILNLSVLPVVMSNVNVSVCQGQSYYGHTTAGVYTDTLHNAGSNGCDSIRVLHLTVQTTIRISDTVHICQGMSYGGHSNSGIYIDSALAVGGCDSIHTLNLSIMPISHTTVTQAICVGESSGGHTATGTYIDTLTSSSGCDSIITLQLTIFQPSASNLNQQICSGGSYLGHYATGTFADTLHNAAYNGCDSIRVLHLTVLPQGIGNITTSICQGDSFLGHYSSGVYYDTLYNGGYYGCDSIRVVHLLVLQPSVSTIYQTICAGESYLSHNISGIFIDTLLNGATNGCDSIRILHLTVTQPSTSTISANICLGQSYLGYNSTGVYIDTLYHSASNGCDSVRTLYLNAQSTLLIFDTLSICEGTSYQGHSATGIYIDTSVAIGGCDSIHTLNLQVLATISTTITQSICAGLSYEGYHTSGIFTDTLSSSNGCDSIRTLNLTVLQPLVSSVSHSICYGQSFLGHSSTGTYIDTLYNSGANGCDSIRTLLLTVFQPANGIEVKTICSGETYLGHDTSGIYTDTLNSASVVGCDSIRTIYLTVIPSISIPDSQIICAGSIYHGYGSSGNYIDTFTASTGCDSLVTLNLIVLPNDTTNILASFCRGDTFDYQGHLFTQSIIFTDTFASQHGCDSIVVLTISQIINETTIYDTIFQNDTYVFAGQALTQSGTYYDTLAASNSCDSIVILDLTVLSFNQNLLLVNAGSALTTSQYGNSFQWIDCLTGQIIPGAISNSYIPTQNGSYACIIGIGSGSSDTSMCYNFVISGFSESELQNIKVYPNPATDVLNIYYSGNETLFVDLQEISGKTILGPIPINTSSYSLKTTNLSSGIYILRMRNSKGLTKTVKVVKEN